MLQLRQVNMEDASNISPEVLRNVAVAIADCNIVVEGQGILLHPTRLESVRWKPRILHFTVSLLPLDLFTFVN
jgi:hypothetical protein